MELASTLGNVLVGQGPVGPLGPQLPTTGIFGSGGKLTLMQALSSGSTLASAGFAIFGAQQQAEMAMTNARQQSRALELTARENELEARREETRGKQEGNDIMDRMIQTIAAQRLASATQGIDIGFGTPVSVEESSRDLANLQLSASREDALTRILSRRRQAAANREQSINTLISGDMTANSARLSGYGKAFGTITNSAIRRLERG